MGFSSSGFALHRNPFEIRIRTNFRTDYALKESVTFKNLQINSRIN